MKVSSLLIAAILVAPHLARAQVRDRAPAAAGTASISGTVTSDTQSPRPIRRAIVYVNSADRTVGRTLVTDDAGRFIFTNLPAGRFSLGANKRGWVTASYGAKTIGRPGRSISLAEGERATATLRMARAAVITGVVLDQNGQPPTGVTMRVLRYAYAFNTGERRLTNVFATSWGPDDRGVYRIFGLSPGEYYVSAQGGPTFYSQGRDLHLTTDVDVQEAQRAVQGGPGTPVTEVLQRSIGIAAVFYPGTSVVAQATPVVVRAGEERGGIDFTIQYVTTAHVEGTVSLSDGPVPFGTQVNLVANDTATGSAGFESLRMARVGPDGRFTFAEVAPGQYTLATRASIPAPAGPNAPPAQVLSAITDVEVQGEDVRGLSLALQEGFTVSGVVRFDGTAAPAPFASMRVNLSPLLTGAGVSVSAGSSPLDANGRFTVTGVAPGRYRLLASLPSSQSPWIVRSAIVAGQDTLDVPADIRQAITDAVITLTDRAAELSGRIENAAAGAAPDYSIILFPENRAYWSPPARRILSTRTASDGTYAIKNVPPGDYLIAAVDDVEPNEWYDPAFLQRLAPVATKISIADGEKKAHDIRIGGG